MGLPAERLKYSQVNKIMKHTRTDTNYAILTKRIKLQHEKKPKSNLKSMQSVGFQQTSTKFRRFSFCKNIFFIGKKNSSGNHLSGHLTDSSDDGCSDLHVINIFTKFTKEMRRH